MLHSSVVRQTNAIYMIAIEIPYQDDEAGHHISLALNSCVTSTMLVEYTFDVVLVTQPLPTLCTTAGYNSASILQRDRGRRRRYYTEKYRFGRTRTGDSPTMVGAVASVLVLHRSRLDGGESTYLAVHKNKSGIAPGINVTYVDVNKVCLRLNKPTNPPRHVKRYLLVFPEHDY